MTINEYKELANTLTPETAPQVVSEIINNIQLDINAKDNLQKINEKLEESNKQLQQTNMQLFLSQTAKVDDKTHEKEEVEKIPTPEESLNDLINLIEKE